MMLRSHLQCILAFCISKPAVTLNATAKIYRLRRKNPFLLHTQATITIRPATSTGINIASANTINSATFSLEKNARSSPIYTDRLLTYALQPDKFRKWWKQYFQCHATAGLPHSAWHPWRLLPACLPASPKNQIHSRKPLRAHRCHYKLCWQYSHL